ncbi:adenylate/guanylate cyclase domain-containing protein [Mycolicibacterium sp. 018/SC-01/001]|uniref:adenylate/guanylate cyclase domain-containing protein n=1 Tax=Mycolicibacterium sp. 018/SC-01/001 TaxID=2592069 RepID=UPI001181089D|nr:adenylate/guanylate cyclase domain-containing protein [Mycolicibacterium sp. 018/SC-01/001]TRW82805.1 adenylate/guanylate cyclase domain-containing protein [Mycolicibacterium sp. 018/SC-01/001]
MGRLWQWLWDRYGRFYSWAIIVAVIPTLVMTYVFYACIIVAFEHSERYAEAIGVVVVAATVIETVAVRLGRRWFRPLEQFAAGQEIDRASALAGTYTYTRKVSAYLAWGHAVWIGSTFAVIGVVAGAAWARVVQYGVVGALIGAGAVLSTQQGILEAIFRPVRVALIGDSDIGDRLPRSRPTFATHAITSMLSQEFLFTLSGALLIALAPRLGEHPVLCALLAIAITLVYGVPFAVGSGMAPRLRPIRDLSLGADRVATGDYSQRLPVAQDDDLGALVGSFNRMQAGLAERQRLAVAFGAYVDPVLAARLLDQGDDVFTGERRVVTVMFLDVRDFTPFAEANSAEDTVARLNDLFQIVVPEVVNGGGHVNKFMGDGAMAVFGAPNQLVQQADAAVAAAMAIQQRVDERFGGQMRIGIGINTGEVIAGTIGAVGHLEFAIIGDTTNVAARVEQLTKTTGDTILLTRQCVDALAHPPSGLVDRGEHALKGKSVSIRVYGLSCHAAAANG